MPAPHALGVRRRCLSCHAAFYDLGKATIACPKCDVEFKVVELPRRYVSPNSRFVPKPPIIIT